MADNSQKANQSLNGVKCSVNTCYYNAQNKCCTAAEIMIKPHNTLADKQTDCSTFTLK